MLDMLSAQSGEALEHFIALSREYVTWMIAEIQQQYPQLDIREFTSEHEYDDLHKKFPGEHVPPNGCLLIARNGEQACGCIALARLTPTICEIRTLYVLPTCRGMGAGKQLALACLDQARTFGYTHARLDTLGFMASAQGLYRSIGFYDIAPYLDLSDSLKQYIHFLECDLSVAGASPDKPTSA